MRLALVALFAALVFAPAAAAGPEIDRAAAALANDPVYVGNDAVVTPQIAAALRQEIRTRGRGPIYIAILPAAALDEAGGSGSGVLDELHRQLDRRGVYAVIAGNQFRAESTDLDRGEAGRLATQAFDAHHDEGQPQVLRDFIDRVGAARANGGGGGGDDGGGYGLGWWPLLIAGGLAFFGFRAFKSRRSNAEEFRAVKATAREDLVALAEDVQQLETRVEGNPEASREYTAALDEYQRASAAFDLARGPRELAPIAEALQEGRYHMASAEARLEGREPPERRPPCFFDPRHGPSVRDVEYAPAGGAEREVPACAACALRVEQGEEPDSRQVLVGGRSRPYWAAGPMYGGYFGGFFPGLLVGELFAGGFGGYGWGAPSSGDGWDSGNGGGDFGGGGGGDFGGGGGDGGGGDF